MKLCVSNIAWEASQEDAAAQILRAHRIDAVEVAPTRYWPAPCAPTASDIDRCRQSWTKRQVPIQAMQALLFGMPALSIFHAEKIGETHDYLIRIVQIGAALGAKRFVFGSPKNRDRGELSAADAKRLAVDFFCSIAETAHNLGVVFCLEPNPPAYQCNFMTNTAEALAIVEAADHPGLGLNLDTGIMCMNNEPFDAAIAAAGRHLSHFHVSHPQLAAVADGGPVDHEAVARALKSNNYAGVVSIEMRAAEVPADNLTRLDVACGVLNRYYRS